MATNSLSMGSPSVSLGALDTATPLTPPAHVARVAAHPSEALKKNADPTLKDEVDCLADALAARFEELALLHGLTQRLTQSMTLLEQSSQIVRSLLTELSTCIDCQSIAIHLVADEATSSEEVYEVAGQTLDRDWMLNLAEVARVHVQEATGINHRISVVNHLCLDDGRSIRVAVVSIHRQSDVLGQMIAIRSVDRDEFGTIEADMMQSTSMMLAVHLINQRQFLQLQHMFQGTIQSLVSALDAKDNYTSGHSNRVSDLSVELAKRLGYDEEQVANIRMGGILHDIGKIGVDDGVLRKPGRLTDEEFEHIKKHPTLGFEILKGIRQFRNILPVVRHHHESWDGSGYPDGLSGEQIPRDAQIMAVADAFDAMTSDRPYRSGMPLEKVKEIFRQGRGKQWAADVVDVLLESPELMKLRNVDGIPPTSDSE